MCSWKQCLLAHSCSCADSGGIYWIGSLLFGNGRLLVVAECLCNGAHLCCVIRKLERNKIKFMVSIWYEDTLLNLRIYWKTLYNFIVFCMCLFMAFVCWDEKLSSLLIASPCDSMFRQHWISIQGVIVSPSLVF